MKATLMKATSIAFPDIRFIESKVFNAGCRILFDIFSHAALEHVTGSTSAKDHYFQSEMFF